MKWEQLMVGLLLELRAGGETDFDRAWRRAQAIGRERGFPRPRDYVEPGYGLEPFSSFFRHACEREWLGAVQGDYMALRELLAEPDAGLPRQRGRPRDERVTLLA